MTGQDLQLAGIAADFDALARMLATEADARSLAAELELHAGLAALMQVLPAGPGSGSGSGTGHGAGGGAASLPDVVRRIEALAMPAGRAGPVLAALAHARLAAGILR